jgi:hypothetical protein
MQLQINFTGKKDQRITFAADDDLTDLLKSVAKDLGGREVSDLVRGYVIECVTRDKGKLMLMKARGDKVFVSMTA